MDAAEANLGPILVEAPGVHRVWGGNRYPAMNGPIGEVWLVHQSNVIVQGPCAGQTLSTAVETMGGALLGSRLIAQGEREFPLLIKLIDAAEWLSIQVHPDDAHAAALEGPAHRGKTEAWYVLDSDPGSEIIAGMQAGVTSGQAVSAIRSGEVLGLIQHFEMKAGDAVMLPAGAVHALGPGLFIYEIQQSSDITYRLHDWNRQPSDDRPLHIDKAAISAKPSLRIAPLHIANPTSGELTTVAQSDFFGLQLGSVGTQPLELAPAGNAFHVVTVIEGEVVMRGAGWTQDLTAYRTALVPALTDTYSIEGRGPARFLLATPA